MSDLLHIQREVGEKSGSCPLLQDLKRIEQQKDGAIVDGQRAGRRIHPTGTARPALKERVFIWIKDGAAEGRQAKRLVLNAAINGAEYRKQTRPGIMTAFQHILPQLFPVFIQPGAQRADGVMLIVDRLTEQEEFSFLRTEGEHQPHHDGKTSLIKLSGRHILQKLAITVEISPIQSLHQYLDSAANLGAKCVGDFI